MFKHLKKKQYGILKETSYFFTKDLTLGKIQQLFLQVQHSPLFICHITKRHPIVKLLITIY